MAIFKELILPNGLAVSYHRVEKIMMNADQVTGVGWVGSYVDEEHRGKVFHPVVAVKVPFVKVTEDLVADCYVAVLATIEFSNGVEV